MWSPRPSRTTATTSSMSRTCGLMPCKCGKWKPPTCPSLLSTALPPASYATLYLLQQALCSASVSFLLLPPASYAPLYLLRQAICSASVSYLFIAAAGLVCTSLLAPAGTAGYMFCFCFLFIYCRHRPGLHLSTCSSRHSMLYVLLLFPYLFIAATGLVCTSLLAPAGYMFCFCFLFISLFLTIPVRPFISNLLDQSSPNSQSLMWYNSGCRWSVWN